MELGTLDIYDKYYINVMSCYGVKLHEEMKSSFKTNVKVTEKLNYDMVKFCMLFSGGFRISRWRGHHSLTPGSAIVIYGSISHLK